MLMSKNKNRKSIIFAGIFFAMIVALFLYLMVDFKTEDADFIMDVNSNAITANILLINVVEENGSTSFSAGQSGVIFKLVNQCLAIKY